MCRNKVKGEGQVFERSHGAGEVAVLEPRRAVCLPLRPDAFPPFVCRAATFK